MAPMANFTVPTRSLTSAKERVLTPGTTSTQENDFVFFEPVFIRSTKAERVLGPAEIFHDGSHGKKSNASTLSRLRLKRFTTKSPSNSGLRSDRTADNLKERNRPQAQASSPLLGCPHTVAKTMASTTNSGSLRPDTSSTPSHYDPLSSPLSISQQTSASSSRDMALRKGMSMDRQNPVQASSMSPIGIVDGELGEYPEEVKRRPPHLDFSTLSPIPRHPTRPSTSPNQMVGSPSIMSVVSESHLSPSSSRRGWLRWRSDKSKGSPKYSNEITGNSPRVKEYDPFFVEACAGKLGVDMDIWSAAGKTWKPSNVAARGDPLDPRTAGQSSPCSSLNSPSRKSSGSVVTLTSQASIKDTAHEPQSLHSLPPRKPSNSFSRPNLRNTSSTSRTQQKDYTDLCKHSVLSLSSSESEGDEVLEIPNKSRPRFPNKGKPEIPLDIVGYNQSKTLTLPRQRRMSEEHFDDLSQDSPYWSNSRIPEASGALDEPPQKYSNLPTGLCQTQETEDSNSCRPGAEVSASISANCASEPAVSERKGNVLHTDRVMAVTREEERLLEAMREKKASMRRAETSVKGFNTAMEQRINLLPRRPKTADTSRRASSFFDAEIASFPAPPSLRSLQSSRLSGRTVSSEDSARLPELDSTDESPLPALRDSFLGPPVASSHFSYTPSDVLPSPSTSQGSPLTPPPHQLSTRFGQDAHRRLPGLSSHRDSREHYKRRTVSDDMILLEGLQKEMREEVLDHWADSGYEAC